MAEEVNGSLFSLRETKALLELGIEHHGRYLTESEYVGILAVIDNLRDTVLRAAFIAEHLMQMIDRETWRATGGDDGQGHYEGDYREASTFEEIQAWKAMAE